MFHDYPNVKLVQNVNSVQVFVPQTGKFAGQWAFTKLTLSIPKSKLCRTSGSHHFIFDITCTHANFGENSERENYFFRWVVRARVKSFL